MPIPVIMIVGSTGVGKTKLSIDLAKRLNGEIIGIDSIQIYDCLDVTSAKPTPDEQQEIPHHCVSSQPWYQPIELHTYLQQASECIESIHNRGKVPIVVGGTFYYCEQLLLNTYANQSALGSTLSSSTPTPSPALSSDCVDADNNTTASDKALSTHPTISTTMVDLINPEQCSTLSAYSSWLTTLSTDELYHMLLMVDRPRALVIGKNNRKLRRNLEIIYEHKTTVTNLYAKAKEVGVSFSSVSAIDNGKGSNPNSIVHKQHDDCDESSSVGDDEHSTQNTTPPTPNDLVSSSSPSPSLSIDHDHPTPSPGTHSFLVSNRLKYDVCMLWVDADLEVVYQRCLKRVCDMLTNHLLLEVLELFTNSVNYARYSYSSCTHIISPSAPRDTTKKSTSSALSFFSPMGKLKQFSSLQLVNTTIGIWQCIGGKELLPWIDWLVLHGVLQTTCSCSINKVIYDAQGGHQQSVRNVSIVDGHDLNAHSIHNVCGCCVFVPNEDPMEKCKTPIPCTPTDPMDGGVAPYSPQCSNSIPVLPHCDCQRQDATQLLYKIFSDPIRLSDLLISFHRSPCSYECPYAPNRSKPQSLSSSSSMVSPRKRNVHQQPPRALHKHTMDESGEVITTTISSPSNYSINIDDKNKSFLQYHASGDIASYPRLLHNSNHDIVETSQSIPSTSRSPGEHYEYNHQCTCIECEFLHPFHEIPTDHEQETSTTSPSSPSSTRVPHWWCLNISLLAHCLHEVVLSTIKLAKQQKKWIASRLLTLSVNNHNNSHIIHNLQSMISGLRGSQSSSSPPFFPHYKSPHGSNFSLYQFDSSQVRSEHHHPITFSWEIQNIISNALKGKKQLTKGAGKNTSKDITNPTTPWIVLGEVISQLVKQGRLPRRFPCIFCDNTTVTSPPSSVHQGSDHPISIWNTNVAIPSISCSTTFLNLSTQRQCRSTTCLSAATDLPNEEHFLTHKHPRSCPVPIDCDDAGGDEPTATPPLAKQVKRSHHVNTTCSDEIDHQNTPHVTLYDSLNSHGPCSCDYLILPQNMIDVSIVGGPDSTDRTSSSSTHQHQLPCSDKTPIVCDICSITCIGNKQWDLHVRGKKHKYHLKLKKA